MRYETAGRPGGTLSGPCLAVTRQGRHVTTA